MFKVGDQFETLVEAKEAIKAVILNSGQSFTVYKSDSSRYLLRCKNLECKFNVRITYSKKTELAILTQYHEHECSPAIHYSNPAAAGVKYLKIHHHDSVTDNNHITPGIPSFFYLILPYTYIYIYIEREANSYIFRSITIK
jgi:hypothetical protein